jgi:glycosyltransferase involved in cell wall biosynthesis
VPVLVDSFDNLSGLQAEITVVMPVFNQEAKVQANLEALFDSLTLPARVIVIDDASQDGTLLSIERFIELFRKRPSWLARIETYRTKTPYFETKCDAFGLDLCTTSFAIEVQADMELKDPGFDGRLVSAMRAHPDLLMISGRGTEPLSPIVESFRNSAGSDVARGRTVPRHLLNSILRRFVRSATQPTQAQAWKGNEYEFEAVSEQISPSSRAFSQSGQAGRVGHLIEISLPHSSIERRLWLGQTVMRGPLIIDIAKYRQLQGLDQKSFFLGYDEHDLVARAYQRHGFRVGYTPVGFLSPLADGSTRKRRTLKNEYEVFTNLLRISRSRRRTTLYNLGALPDSTCYPANEIRDF